MREFATVGNKAPDFPLPDADGEMHSLADCASRFLVLYFYPENSTSGCTAEAQEFSELLPDFAALNATVIEISKDSRQSHRKCIGNSIWAQSGHNLGVTLLSDPATVVLPDYGA